LGFEFPRDEGEDALGIRRYTDYGAILYEDKGFRDKAKVITYMTVAGEPHEEIIDTGEIKISSIRPFVLAKPGLQHKAVLYEETDYNFGGDTSKKTISLRLDSCMGSLSFIPQSIEIIGDYIVILCEGPNNTGESEVFVEPGDPDLNNNRVACWGWHCRWLGLRRWCKRSCVKSACTYGAKLY
ncbi:unnamed protein product, partial [marine sediment metagenome]